MSQTIDVLFPYYGDVEMMKKAVNSVLNQSYENWTLKVFDDGYPSDEPERFFNELIENEKISGKNRITYEKNEKNLGANGNYRKALDRATSEYYVMMGADDMMKSDFLKKFVERLDEVGKIDIYQPYVDVIDENDKVYLPLVDKIKRKIMPKNTGKYQGEEIAKSYINGWHYFPSMIWRTESARNVGFNTDYDVVQDVNMGLDIIKNGGILYFDKDNTTFNYRRHSQSDSSVKALNGYRFDEEKNFYDHWVEEFDALGWEDAKKVAKKHYLSRMNALTLLPKAMSNPDGDTKKLMQHILGKN